MPNPGVVTFAEDAAAVLQTVYAAAAADANVTGISFDYLDENAKLFAETRGAELVGMKWVDGKLVTNPNAEWAIDATTRDEVQTLLEQALKEGWSSDEFADALDSGIFSEERAEMIARTELGIAQNTGQVDTYKEIGFEALYVYDGDCDECREVDGLTCSLDWAAKNPLQHPNCVRSFGPVPMDEPVEIDLE